MKLALAAALGGFQSLSHDETRERPVDRIAALGAAQIAAVYDAHFQAQLCSLGVDLIRAKWANVPEAVLDATDKLAAVLTGRPGRRDDIAKQAVREWLVDFCPSCLGAKEIPASEAIEGPQPMKPCPACRATGKRRWSDQERISALGDKQARALAEAHGLISRAESLAVGQAMRLLEHWA